MTRELFDALASRDTARIDKVLSRIQDASPADLFPELLRRQIRLRDGLGEINRELAQGRLSAAQAVLARLRRQLGETPELLAVNETLNALAAVSNHRRHAPYRTSALARKSLDAVAAMETPVQNSPLYAAWKKTQEETIAQLVVQERLASFRKRLLAYGTLAAADDPAAGTELAALRTEASSLPELSAAVRLLLGEVPETAALEPFLAPAAWKDAAARPALEILFCREWPRLPEALRNRAALLPDLDKSATVCGELLEIRAAVQSGRTPQACRLAERLLRSHAVAPSLVAEWMGAMILPQEQLKGKAWTAPFPTLTDYLDRLEQLRRSAPGP